MGRHQFSERALEVRDRIRRSRRKSKLPHKRSENRKREGEPTQHILHSFDSNSYILPSSLFGTTPINPPTVEFFAEKRDTPTNREKPKGSLSSLKSITTTTKTMVTLRSDSADMERPHSRPRMPHAPRPPSANTNPARTATTSRRGGRTRARSPAVSGGRMMDENPSSAAAAAAAAAKAFSNASSRASVASGGGRDDRSTGSSYGPPPGYEGGYPPHKWPGGDPNKRGGGNRMHYPPRYGPPPGYSGAYPPPHEYGDRRYRGEHPPPPHRGGPHPPPPHEGGGNGGGPRSRYPVDYRYHSRGAGPTTPPKGSRGGTSLVLGGATPIHVPKTAAPPPPSAAGRPERSPRASATSGIFRGRSSVDAPPPLDDEAKILISLKTPSTSFEEKKESDGTSLQLSPDDPPKILSSTQQQRAVDMFEVRWFFLLHSRGLHSRGE